MRILPIVLSVLLLFVHAELWFGKDGMPYVMRLQGQLRDQAKKNTLAEQRNAQLVADIDDLKDGQEMVEERARFELGMIKPNEIYVHLTSAP